MGAILIALAGLLLGTGLWLVGRRLGQLERKLAQLEAEREALHKRLDALGGNLEQSSLDAAALRISTLGLGAQLERLERAQNLLEAQLGQIERGAVQAANYAQAIRQAARGHVGVEDLVQDFGLPRGEAELLLRMHRNETEEEALAQRLRGGR